MERELRNVAASVHARLLTLARDRGQELAYPKEAVVAEKTQAMVELGLLNSRLKDYFDVCHLARTQAFDGGLLQTAMKMTLDRRDTPIPQDRVEQWVRSSLRIR